MTRKKNSQNSRRLPPPRPYPWLMFAHGGEHGTTQTFYSIPEGHHYTRRILDLSGMFVCASSGGWLLVKDRDPDFDNCFLLNPVSMEKINLPPYDNSFEDRSCVFQWSPNDSANCFVAFFSTNCFWAMVWRPGQEDWTRVKYTCEDKDLVWRVTLCDEKIYALLHIGVGLVHIYNDGQLEVKRIMSKGGPDSLKNHNFHLIGSCGEIFLVYMTYLGETFHSVDSIDVYKLQRTPVGDDADWVAMDSIGDRAFFVNSSRNCFSVSKASELGLKENSIYFTRNGEDKSLYVFDLKDRRIEICLPCPHNVVSGHGQTYWLMIEES